MGTLILNSTLEATQSTEWINFIDVQSKIHSTFLAHEEPSTAVLIALYAVVMVAGVAGNLMVVYTFARGRVQRTVTTALFVNLALCDLTVVVWCAPFSIANEIYRNWIYGNAMCRLVNFGQGVVVAASILSLVVISGERFYAIRQPLKAYSSYIGSRKRRLCFTLTSIWLLSTIAATPTLLVRREELLSQVFGVQISACLEQWNSRLLKQLYNFSLLIGLYIAPVLAITIGYYKIASKLLKDDGSLYCNLTRLNSRSAQISYNGRRKVARMLLIMACLFAFSWLPYHLLSISFDLLSENDLIANGNVLSELHAYSLWLGHSNSAINPICYYAMSRRFRVAVSKSFNWSQQQNSKSGGRGDHIQAREMKFHYHHRHQILGRRRPQFMNARTLDTPTTRALATPLGRTSPTSPTSAMVGIAEGRQPGDVRGAVVCIGAGVGAGVGAGSAFVASAARSHNPAPRSSELELSSKGATC